MSELKRIIIHWTAGQLTPNQDDFEDYHYVVDGKGKVIAGKYKPEDNINCKDGKYSQHTGGLNTGSIGISACGMLGFISPNHVEKKYALTEKQIEALCKQVAVLAIRYQININRDNIMTHYEVGQRYGKKGGLLGQNIGKVDITYLPFKPELRAGEVGDYLRNRINWYYSKLKK